MPNSKAAFLVAIGAVLALVTLKAPALAELQVTSSTVPGINAGAKLPDDAIFEVAEGQLLRLLNAENGNSFEIEGPYKGTVDAYTKGCSWWDGLTGKCIKSRTDDTGATPGATRGLSIESDELPVDEKQ